MPKTTRIKKSDFRHSTVIGALGVNIKVVSNDPIALDEITSALSHILPGLHSTASDGKAEHEFRVVRNPTGRDALYQDGKLVWQRMRRSEVIERLGTHIRLTVAEHAVGHVFVHAGVVTWKDKAIVIPARSMKGKTTLVSELVKLGAVYYSDEYAVIDREGFVHPFAKPLSIRGEIDAWTQVEYDVESLGGKAGKSRCGISMIVLTEFRKNAKFSPKFVSGGKAMLAMIENTLPIRRDPKFVLDVLARSMEKALFVSGHRGNAADAAPIIIQLMDEHT